MQRLAILADIHGNMPALRAVIADIESEAPDQILVGGDLVGRGPEGSRVIATIDGVDQLRYLMTGDNFLGHGEASWRLVHIYERGFPAEINAAAARRELQRAVNRHHFHATRELASRLEYGKRGFAQDLPRAIAMYEMALEAGNDNRYEWNLDPENFNHFRWLESRLKQARMKLDKQLAASR